jgi:hypothetical protein
MLRLNGEDLRGASNRRAAGNHRLAAGSSIRRRNSPAPTFTLAFIERDCEVPFRLHPGPHKTGHWSQFTRANDRTVQNCTGSRPFLCHRHLASDGEVCSVLVAALDAKRFRRPRFNPFTALCPFLLRFQRKQQLRSERRLEY